MALTGRGSDSRRSNNSTPSSEPSAGAPPARTPIWSRAPLWSSIPFATCNCRVSTCPKCGFRLEYNSRTKVVSRGNHDAAVQLPDVQADLLFQREGPHVLQSGLSDQRAPQDADHQGMPDVSEELQTPLSADSLQHSLWPDSQDGATLPSALHHAAAVQAVRRDLPPDVEQDGVVQQGMLWEMEQPQQAWQVHDDEGIRPCEEARSSGVGYDRRRHGTSAGHGSSPGPRPDEEGSRPSQERQEGRQPSGESATHDEDSPRWSAEAAQPRDHLPSLSEADTDLECCPHCQTRLTNGPLAPRRPRVMDCFAGSGRTGIAAARLGCDFVGVGLSPAYAAMARRLLCVRGHASVLPRTLESFSRHVRINSTMSNGHGGKRRGAGRKPGGRNTRSREIADRLAAEGGVLPLEVMLLAM